MSWSRVDLPEPIHIIRQTALYKTPSPGTSLKSGEFYQLVLERSSEGLFTLTERHGNWDECEGQPVPGYTRDAIGQYPSSEEGNAAFEKRKVLRAKEGFMHSLRPGGDDPRQDIYELVDLDSPK